MHTSVPDYSLADAARILQQSYHLSGRVTALPSERDQNFHIRADERSFVLKIANANESRAVLEAENDVMRHLAATGLCPQLTRSQDGDAIVRDGAHDIRLITALPGQPLGGTAWQTASLRRDVGRALASLDHALQTLDLPAFHRHFHWDLAHAADIVDAKLPLVADDALRACIAVMAARHRATVVPMLPALRQSLIHADANDYNVLVDARQQRVTGIVDFGDMLHSHTVNDVAIAMAYAALHARDPLTAAADVLAGYHAVFPLTEPEVSALFSLMCMRLCMSVCIGAEQRAARPDVDYLGISQQAIRTTLPRLADTHPRYAHYALRAACGWPPVPHAPRVEAWLKANAESFAFLTGDDLRDVAVVPIDLSVGSTLLSSNSVDNTPDAVDRRVRYLLAEQGATIGAGGYDEPRTMYEWTNEPEAVERRTIHMGLDLSMPNGSPLFAPFDGEVHGFEFANKHHDYGPVIVLRHRTDGPDPVEFYVLYGHLTLDSLDGKHVGQRIAKGTEFARVGSAPTNGDWWEHVHVQVITDMLEVPCNVDGAARASQRTVWRSLCPDPNLFLRIPPERLPQHPSTSAIATSRDEHIGRNLSTSYGTNPVHIARGWKQYLFDDEGRRYIDAYNNVAHVGHAHPVVARAVGRQLAVLNTNTRYLQKQLVEYAEALTATLPEPLAVCFFTASGSEANELALRLARAHTGQRDLLVMESAYHGHTTTLIDISPYKHAGPGGRGAPDWVHTTPIPDVYRNREVAGEPGAWFAARVGDAIAHLTAHDRKLCGYIAESCPSVGGQIMLPAGFLRDVYARVRRAGGVCIADEVQTGFGRIGTHFWGFEQQGVIPDIVVLGKPMANGYPMGAVITTRAIADSFDNGMEFFSTFGGSTAACVAGRATLAVTLDECLQEHALRVGERLLWGLRAAQGVHEVVGDVRGSGLFLGVEVVSDRERRTPDATAATWIVNRMRVLGVLAGTDGPHHNVIKLRGPMPLSLDDADRIVETITQALREIP